MGLKGVGIRRWHVAATVASFALVFAVVAVVARPGPPATRGAAPGPGPATGTQPCRGTQVVPGDHVQRALDAASAGATVCFAAGTYRLTEPLTPADGQRLMAAPGAVLTGAVRLAGWQGHGPLWRARGALPADPILHGECVKGTLCRYAEAVYIEDRALDRVGSRDRVGPGRFWADYDANEIWIGDDPTGRVVEVARTAAALAGPAKDVTVEGFVVERFANIAQRGAIHADGGGWTIRRNEVRANHGTGIHATGGQVLANHIHHNGQLGLLGTGDGQLVEGNEIDHNNTAGFSPIWEAGATKFARTDGLIIRGNNVHDNAGQGLWTDINNIRTTIEDNVVHANSGHGILHEISYRAVIRDNRVTDNGGAEPMLGWGGAGIRVAASPDVEVYGNALAGNQNAIMVVQQRRDDWPSPHGAHLVRNIEVRDNEVTLAGGGMVGQVDDTGSDASYGRHIRFRDNTYRLPSTDAKVFAWQGMAWDPTTWRQRFDQDASSRFTVG
jgi:parallel beta-helix repeat protein